MANSSINTFTILEIIAAIIIVVLFLAMFYPFVTEQSEQVRINETRASITKLQAALDAFKADNGFYPTETQGLRALIFLPSAPPSPLNWRSEGYMDRLIELDAWGRPFIYKNPGQYGEIDIYSLGPPDHATSQKRGIIGNWEKK